MIIPATAPFSAPPPPPYGLGRSATGAPPPHGQVALFHLRPRPERRLPSFIVVEGGLQPRSRLVATCPHPLEAVLAAGARRVVRDEREADYVPEGLGICNLHGISIAHMIGVGQDSDVIPPRPAISSSTAETSHNSKLSTFSLFPRATSAQLLARVRFRC
jgi:hypothetical protein